MNQLDLTWVSEETLLVIKHDLTRALTDCKDDDGLEYLQTTLEGQLESVNKEINQRETEAP